MTTKAPGGGVLRLRGRPQSLTALLPAPAADERVATVRVELPGSDGPVELRGRVSRPDAGLSQLRVKLPPATPPGTYDCDLRVGAHEQPVVIEVEAYPRTRLLCNVGHFGGPPQSRHTATTTAVNLGNVGVDVPDSVSVRLTDDNVLDAVLTAVSSESDSERRLRAFADGLAGADGGTIVLSVDAGAGTLEPGTTRELSASFAMPAGLSAGRTYVGQWHVGETRYSIRLSPTLEPAAKQVRQRKAG